MSEGKVFSLVLPSDSAPFITTRDNLSSRFRTALYHLSQDTTLCCSRFRALLSLNTTYPHRPTHSLSRRNFGWKSTEVWSSQTSQRPIQALPCPRSTNSSSVVVVGFLFFIPGKGFGERGRGRDHGGLVMKASNVQP